MDLHLVFASVAWDFHAYNLTRHVYTCKCHVCISAYVWLLLQEQVI